MGPRAPDLTAFAPHVEYIESLVHGSSALEQAELGRSIKSALDGEVAANLRRLVSLLNRRELGAFFTGSTLRSRAVSDVRLLADRPCFADPTCGAGDLLIAAAEHLPLGENLRETLSQWGEVLHGMDLQPLFIRATKARLSLLAQSRLGSFEPVNSNEWFPNIRVGNSLTEEWCPERCGGLLLNPPYGAMAAPEDCGFGTGLVSAAAVFTFATISKLPVGCVVRAILPDVLRAGTRYAKWRTEIAKILAIQSISILGQFDSHTDVDVFLLSGTRGTSDTARWTERASRISLGQFFKVRVGTVVPHRDEESGEDRPYLTARTLSGKIEFDSALAPRLRHLGHAFQPPFIVVRRTSRPGDEPRLNPTLIKGEEPVFVENHLLVLSPIHAHSCVEAVSILRSQSSTDWMNARIRCRHLTVGALLDLPWQESGREI